MSETVGRLRTLVNFGRNLKWQTRCYRPRNEDEVLEILERHRSDRIRAVGSLHSWSDAAQVAGITLDMGEFVDVRPYGKKVQVGGGCTLERLLEQLHSLTGRTLPTIGAIKRQTLAGLISTATHGSGKPSLSHFVTAVRVAAYDDSGRSKLFDYRGGEELRAARCALGRMGIVLQVELATVPDYRVRETIRCFDNVEDALQLYDLHPLTQFGLVPHGWKVIAWERHPMPPGNSGNCPIRAALFRINNRFIVDFLFHVVLKASLFFGVSAARTLMKRMPTLLQPVINVPRVDRAEEVLTLRHDLFKHEEMEMFVPESKVPDAAALLRNALEIFAGDAVAVREPIASRLSEVGLYEELLGRRGTYVHHYPIIFRRVLPEDALISMAGSSDEAWFSVSLFTYFAPGKRQAFYELCSWCARAMHAIFGTRLHWGKHYPRLLDADATARVHPGLNEFKEHCRARDPNGVFRNDFTDRVLGA